MILRACHSDKDCKKKRLDEFRDTRRACTTKSFKSPPPLTRWKTHHLHQNIFFKLLAKMSIATTTTEVLNENYWCGNNKINGTFGTNKILSEDSIVGDFDTIPLIDVAGIFSPDVYERKKVAAQLYDACTRVGFFYIQNHGISQESIDAVFNWGKRFFALSFDEKMEIYINNTPNYRGYTPLGGSGSPGPAGQGSKSFHFAAFIPGLFFKDHITTTYFNAHNVRC